MKFEDFKKLVEKWQEEELQVLEKKANDYASSGDSLSNFQNTAIMCEIPVEKVFQVMLSIKLCRLVQLSSGKEAKNEAAEDSLLDMGGYCKLYRAYLTEKNNNGN